MKFFTVKMVRGNVCSSWFCCEISIASTQE